MRDMLIVLVLLPWLGWAQGDTCWGEERLARLVNWEYHRFSGALGPLHRVTADPAPGLGVGQATRLCTIKPDLVWVTFGRGWGPNCMLVARDSVGGMHWMLGYYYDLLESQGWQFDVDPQPVPVPGLSVPSGPTLAICYSQNDRGDQHTLRLVAIIGDTTVVVHHLLRTGDAYESDSVFAYAGSDTLQLSRTRAGQQVTAVDYDPHVHQVVVMGAGGMLRCLPFDGDTLTAGIAADSSIDSSEEVTCCGSGFAGTASGRVYGQVDGGEWEQVLAPTGAALRHIDSLGGVGDSGTLAAHENDGWVAYTVEERPYRCQMIWRDYRGHGLLSFDSLLVDQYETYLNTPTVFESSAPHEFVKYDNGVPYPYTGTSPDTFRITLADDEDNVTFPEILIFTAGDTVVLSRVDAPPKTDGVGNCTGIDSAVIGVKGGPHTPRVGLDEFMLILSPDSAHLEVECERSCYTVLTPIGYMESWSPQTTTSHAAWTYGDTMILVMPEQTLEVVNEAPNPAAPTPVRTRAAASLTIVHTRTGAITRLPMPPGERPVSLTLHDPQGRTIAVGKPSHGRIMLGGRLQAMAMCVVSVRFESGRRMEWRVLMR